MFIQMYEPSLFIGVKFFNESKYNRIITERIRIKSNTDTNLRFFGL